MGRAVPVGLAVGLRFEEELLPEAAVAKERKRGREDILEILFL